MCPFSSSMYFVLGFNERLNVLSLQEACHLDEYRYHSAPGSLVGGQSGRSRLGEGGKKAWKLCSFILHS